MRGTAALFDVTLQAGTHQVIPVRLAAHVPGDDMIEAQFRSRQFAAAVLAAIMVTGVNIAAIQSYFPPGQPIIEQQANDPWYGDAEPNSVQPIVTVRFEALFQLGDFQPTGKIIIGILTFVVIDDLGQVPKK